MIDFHPCSILRKLATFLVVSPFMKSRFVLLALFLFSGALSLAHEPSFPSLGGPGTKVLVYSNTAYYRHPDIPGINRWLVLLGHEHGIEVDITEHFKDLMPNVLAKYDVLLLNNANELDKVIPEEQRKSVEQWFASGKKGVVGLHAALVHQTAWPWLTELAGCDFNSDSDYSKAKLIIDPAAKDHPAVRGQPPEFWYEADWTNHDRVVTGLPGFTVLMRVDESTYTPVRQFFQTRGGKPMGADHPVAWIHEPATGGRFFYTEFGHDLRALSTPFARQHILEGIKWAAAAATATPKKQP
jgi:type 1 glutamine amidotransferase